MSVNSPDVILNESVCWLLESKDWQYLNYDYVMQNNPSPPSNINTAIIVRCKLEVTCLLYVTHMLNSHS